MISFINYDIYMYINIDMYTYLYAYANILTNKYICVGILLSALMPAFMDRTV